MTFRFAHGSRLMLLWVAWAIAPQAVLAQNATPPPKGRPIEFSESADSASPTNLTRLEDRSEQLKLLEKDLSKNYLNPFDKFNPRNSLDGISMRPFYMPSAPPSIQSKKLKELLDRRKNWVFMTSEDFTADPTTAEIFNLPEYDENGQEKKEESSLTRFYKSLDRTTLEEKKAKEKKGLAMKPKKEGQGYKPDDLETETEEESQELHSLRESEQALKKLFEARKTEDQALSPFLKPATGSDIFGLSSSTTPSLERSPAQKARMEEFKQLLTPAASPNSSLAPLKPFNSVSPSAPVFGGMENSIGKPKLPSVGSVNPSFGSPVGGSGGISVIPLEAGQRPAGSLTPTRVEPPRVNSAVPVFSVPQRKF